MALHDDVEQESRFGLKTESFVPFVHRENSREEQTRSPNSSDNDRNDDPVTRTDSFARALISAWLVAALLAGALLLLQPPSLVHAPPSSPVDRVQNSAQTYECSDLDYAYQRC